MSLDVGYSYCINLSENDILLIEQRTSENRKIVVLTITRYSNGILTRTRLATKLKVKKKIKNLYFRIMILFNSLFPVVGAVGQQVVLPLPPNISIERNLQNINDESLLNHLKMSRRLEKISLTDDQLKQFFELSLKYKNRYISCEDAILGIRAGGISEWAAVFVLIAILEIIEAFVQIQPLPHMDPVGYLKGNYKNKNRPDWPTSTASGSGSYAAISDRYWDQQRMCSSDVTEQPVESQYQYTFEEAKSMIDARFLNHQLQVKDLKIEYWQVCKKIYHAIEFGLNPADYGFKQSDLLKIRKNGGLIEYVRKGNPIPSFQFVDEFAKLIQQRCSHIDAYPDFDFRYRGAKDNLPGIRISLNPNGEREVFLFDKEKLTFVSAWKSKPGQFQRYVQSLSHRTGAETYRSTLEKRIDVIGFDPTPQSFKLGPVDPSTEDSL